MSDFQTISITLLAGGISGLAMAWAHHQLRPYRLHPVANYTVGSVSCLIAFSTASALTTGDFTQAGIAWAIWVITGAFVFTTYRLDRRNNIRRRLKEQQYEQRAGYTDHH